MSIGDQVRRRIRHRDRCPESGSFARSGVLIPDDGAGLRARQKIEIAIAVEVGHVKSRVGRSNVLPIRLESDGVGESRPGWARTLIAIEIAVAVTSNQSIHAIV